MRKILTIIRREYREAVFKKSFIIMTLLMPLLMLAMTILPSLLVQMDIEEPILLQIYDASGIILQNRERLFKETFDDGTPRFLVNMLDIKQEEELIARGKLYLQEDKIDGLLIIPKNILSAGELTYYSRNIANFDINNRIKNGIAEIIINQRLKSAGLDGKVISELTKGLSLKTLKINNAGSESESGFETEFFSTFIFVFILYITLIMQGFVLMRSIIEEKTSRIIEVLLSSVNPFQLMTGKILGTGSVGLTQYLIWAIFGTALFVAGPSFLAVSSNPFSFSPAVLFYFVLFYLLGFFLYATLYTGVGSLTNSDQEAQQISMPITLMLVVPIIMLTFMIKNPENPVVIIMSYIPFFSPMIMFARINIASPSVFEIWISIGILIITILLMIWIIAKIFRTGILMYGKRPTLAEIVKWFRI